MRKTLDFKLRHLEHQLQDLERLHSAQRAEGAQAQQALTSMQGQVKRLERRLERCEQGVGEQLGQLEENVQQLYRHFNRLLEGHARGAAVSTPPGPLSTLEVGALDRQASTPTAPGHVVAKEHPATVSAAAPKGLVGWALAAVYMLTNLLFWPLHLLNPFSYRKPAAVAAAAPGSRRPLMMAPPNAPSRSP